MEIKYKLSKGEQYLVRWVSDVKIEKNKQEEFYTKSCILYQDTNNLQSFSRVFGNINLLTNQAIVGTEVLGTDDVAQILQQNGERPQKTYIINVLANDLVKTSEALYVHLGYPSSSNFKNDKVNIYSKLATFLNLPDESFGYSYAHKLEHLSSDEFDYILIPSFEILRYFFLKGSRLTKSLFEYFITECEYENQNIESLYLHTSDEAYKIKIGQNGERIANLVIANGFHELEKRGIIDIAFIRNAFDCVELIKESLMNDTKNEKPFGKIKTKIPVDTPFQMCVGGNIFEWKDKKYLMVSQIFATNEEKPYDLIELSTFSDYRKSKKNNDSSNIKQSSGIRLQTMSTNNAKVTDEILGDRAQAGIIEITTNVPFGFLQKEVPIKQLSKEEQEQKYGSSSIMFIEQEVNSINEGIGTEGGRVRTKNSNKVIEQNDIRRETFINALKGVNNFNIMFLQIDKKPSCYIKGNDSNKDLVITKKGGSYNIVFCQVKNDNDSYCYIIRADNDESDKARYGLYSEPNLKKIEPNHAWYLVTNLFREKGIYLNKGVLKSFTKYIDTTPDYKNQGDKTVNQLLQKLQGEIVEFFHEKEQTHLK